MSTAHVDLDTLLQERLDGHFGSELFIEAATTGDKLSKSDLNAIRKWTRTDIPAEDLYVFPVLAIDTAPTRNMVIYSEDSQRKSVKKWVGTTFLFNAEGTQGLFDGGPDHKLQAASQFARIFKSSLVKTPKGTVGTLVWVYTVKGISEDVDAFIKKIDAGILREVSIHVQASEIICSICQAPFSECKEAHYPGETYGKKVCYMETRGQVTPLELSVVACPGSLAAHVMDDDEVGEYTVLSLREALGGSQEALAIIQEQRNVNTPENQFKCEHEGCEHVAETQDALTEHAASHTAPAPQHKCEHAGCEHVAETPEALTEHAKSHEAPPAPKTTLGALFEGACPACGRNGSTQTEGAPPAACTHEFDATVAEIRTEAAQRVQQIMEAHNGAVATLTAERDALQERANERDAMFTEFVADTVTQAIAKGVKSEDCREDYTTELSALSYPAVKQIRETLAAVTTPVTPKQKLQESMEQRFQQNFKGSTAEAAGNGQTKIKQGQRPRFASQIGPSKK